MNTVTSAPHKPGSDFMQEGRPFFRVTDNLNRNRIPMKAFVHLVKSLQRCLAPHPPVRNVRFIEWDLPFPLEK